MTFGKLQALSSLSFGKKRLSSGNPSNEAVVMEVASDGAFWNLVTPRHQQGLQLFHCDPWGFCCFSQQSPQYPGGQDAVASSRFSTVPYLLNSIQFYLYSAFNKGALSQSCFTENRPSMSTPRATVARKNSLADNSKKAWAQPDSEGEQAVTGWHRF